MMPRIVTVTVNPSVDISEKECAALIEVVRATPTDCVVISGSLPEGVPANLCRRLVREAKAHGAKVALDTSDAALEAGLDEGVFLAKPNLKELRRLSGGTLDDETSRKDAAENLVAEGRAEAVALTLGADGDILVARDGGRSFAPPAIEPLSSVGAGDSFLAGIVLKLSQGADPMTAMTFGLAAGSAALLTPGTALCRRGDVERLYEQMRRSAG
jgi:6-phosphofructokinase 2